MKKQITCIICPRGCVMTAELAETIQISGNRCDRGRDHGIGECTNPLRSVTSIVRVANRKDTMVSVKTENPVPKGKMGEVVDQLRKLRVDAPVAIGDVILQDIFGTRIIATKEIV